MSMSTGQKIALGCGCAALLVGGAVVAFVVVGGYWAKGQIEKAGGSLEAMAAKAEETARFERQANAYPFTPPADGVIQEAQLLKFLDVRKEIFVIYEQHKGEFESLAQRSKGRELSFGETITGAGQIASLVTDVRHRQAKALAGQGMSEAEYRYIQFAVYKSFYGAAIEQDTGKQASELMAEAQRQLAGAARQAAEAARQSGVQGAEGVSEADVRAAEQAAAEGARQLDNLKVPQANVDLFRKHEAEIKKYAMHGLAFLGI